MTRPTDAADLMPPYWALELLLIVLLVGLVLFVLARLHKLHGAVRLIAHQTEMGLAQPAVEALKAALVNFSIALGNLMQYLEQHHALMDGSFMYGSEVARASEYTQWSMELLSDSRARQLVGPEAMAAIREFIILTCWLERFLESSNKRTSALHLLSRYEESILATLPNRPKQVYLLLRPE